MQDFGQFAEMLYLVLLFALLTRLVVSNTIEKVLNPQSFFFTRPDLQAPILTIELSKTKLLSRGYFFFGTYQSAQNGPLIYSNDGDLVWSGFGSSGPGIAHGIQVCNYRNESHLCFFQGTQMVGYGKGHGVIMDKHYHIVRTISPAGPSMSMDLHEFMLGTEGKSAVMTIYHPRSYDLSEWGIKNGMGWVQDGIFQEVDVETGSLLFEWRSLDHVDPEESQVKPATTEISGDGCSKDTPWDYFHINSIDKNNDGHFLISARHTSTIYKISGKDGHIMWRLNGIKSDYKLINFNFAFQHDARWISDNQTHTLISLFDNASNGFNHTSAVSRGMIIVVEHQRKVARIIREYIHPHPNGIGIRAQSQGNMQILSGGHIVQGWGPNCYITEHLADGTPIFSAWVARVGTMIYRVYKFEWEGEPLWNPSVWSFSKDRTDTVFYASWNGATKYTKWRFYGAQTRHGPWILAAIVNRTGFETRCHYHSYYPYVYAAAEQDDVVVKESPVETTFTPGPVIKGSCDTFACPPAVPKILVTGTGSEHNDRGMAEDWQFDRLFRPSPKTMGHRLVLKALSGAFFIIGMALLNRKVRTRMFASLRWSKEFVIDVRCEH